ncbi:MAG: hypothetical protein HRT44_03345 [Bdellovibrionales bacterium]|nr:hypothetical protein [Bdellovibrionales bacterium]NQZ18282.1 hypothetical protein [Bdellovibrionales bacterium]
MANESPGEHTIDQLEPTKEAKVYTTNFSIGNKFDDVDFRKFRSVKRTQRDKIIFDFEYTTDRYFRRYDPLIKEKKGGDIIFLVDLLYLEKVSQPLIHSRTM